MAFRTSFERVYGFELLDELHNFFPELMYDEEIFTDSMAAYMRHRVRTLFPNVYMRNENIYNIYERVNRRRSYDTWRQSYFPSIAMPPPPPSVPAFQIPPARNRVDVDVSGAEVPILETPPPITRGRLLGVNTLGGTRAPRREVSWFAASFPRQQTMEPVPYLLSEDTTLTAGLLNLLNIGLAGGAGAGAGADLFQDVEVALTSEQITAGSHIREAADVPPETVCAICLEHPSEASGWRVLRCSHMYHTECIDTWFRSHVACPVCRTDLRTFSNSRPREFGRDT